MSNDYTPIKWAKLAEDIESASPGPAAERMPLYSRLLIDSVWRETVVEMRFPTDNSDNRAFGRKATDYLTHNA